MRRDLRRPRPLPSPAQAVERLGANVTQPTRAALAAGPDPLEARLRRVEHPVVLGEDPHLEVAPPVAFRPEPRAGEVRAPEVERSPVDRDHLQVHARALAHRELRLEALLAREL